MAARNHSDSETLREALAGVREALTECEESRGAMRGCLAELNDALASTKRDLATTTNALAEARRQESQTSEALAEASHRFLNGLNLAVAFLRLQEMRLEDGASRETIATARGRIEALAHFQKHVFTHSREKLVDLGTFLKGAVETIGEATGLECALRSDAARVPDKIAVDLAIALNELLMNAAKHAYSGRGGRVEIDCLALGSGMLKLEVRDYGDGYRENDLQQNRTLGLELVRSTTRRHNGTLAIWNDGGAHFALTMPVLA